jgi:hypothetical protein
MFKKPLKKIKCNECKKKIKSLMLDIHMCKCLKHFCNLHLIDHNCTFDYFKENKKKLHNTLQKMEKEKINDI